MTDGVGGRDPDFYGRDLVQLPADRARNGGPYASAFDTWFDRATVRTRPRRARESTASTAEVYFTPELAPIATHPLVVAHGAESVGRVLVRRLYDYLHFTAELEQVAVIPIASQIARGRTGIDLPVAMRADAAAIVTDEAFHAQVSYDLASSVESRTGVSPGRLVVPRFVTRLEQIRHSLPADLHGLAGLVFAIISETLITSTLVTLPRDPRLARCVRDVVLDHAVDEGRHHAFFAVLLERLWPCLDRRQAARIGVHIPAMIDAFLMPDARALASELRDLPLVDRQRREIVAQAIDTATTREATAAAATTVRYLEKVGGLDLPEIRVAFAEAGLSPCGPGR